MPPKKDKVKLYLELASEKQKLGRVPLRSRDEERRDEDKLRQQIDRAKKSGGITEEQYRSLTSAGEEDDHLSDALAKKDKAKLYEELALEKQNLGRVPLRSGDEERGDEDKLRQKNR